MTLKSNPRYMQNRELSWLRFDHRVLEEASCPTIPLLERLNFVNIFTTNLDEFFMVRVGSLTDYMTYAPDYLDNKTGMTAEDQLDAIFQACAPLYEERDRAYADVMHQLKKNGLAALQMEELNRDEQKEVERYFKSSILPVLSPQIIDPRHPFPHLNNKQLTVAATLEQKDHRLLGLIPLPSMIQRLFFLSGEERRFLLAEDIIRFYAEKVFRIYKVSHAAVICVTRNADLDTDAGFDEDLDYRQYMSNMLKKRRRLTPVRLEVQGALAEESMKFLCQKLKLTPPQVFYSQTPLDLSFWSQLPKVLSPAQRQELVRPPFVPQSSPAFSGRGSITEQLQNQGDVLLSFPFESMQPFLQLIRESAFDPDVISIKITLYRIARQSKLAESLISAAENGKEVTVLMELRARFDEQNNIEWANRLEEAGCRVIYGMDGYKVHSKICLITRREQGQVRYITQIGTGNYNEKTAKLYTDYSYMTRDPVIGADAAAFFANMGLGNLEGIYQKLWVAPVSFKSNILAGIDEQIRLCRQGLPGRLTFKCNSVTDKDIIQKLREASQAGVQIRMLVRGICCLLPGVPGETENIHIRSLVGQFLEHSRVYCFGEGENCRLYISSGDIMTRNTERRVEIACPILPEHLRRQILSMLDTMFRDDEKARILQPDGTYALPPQGETPLCAQEHFISHLPRFAPPRSQSLRCGEDDQKPHKGIFGLGSVLFRRKTK